MKRLVILMMLTLISLSDFAQKRWKGAATGYWSDAGNWQPTGVPGGMDNVVLDNSLQPNGFFITMPDATVEVYSLSIEPDEGTTIEVVIPPSNKGSPAIIINDNGSGLNIRKGGIFRNSSGLASGQSIQTLGTITIFNGGRYVHSSRSSHATEIVARLAMLPGTEKGIFEFDVPGGSYPISISNRIYGTLVLSSKAAGGVQTYNASGSSPLLLNGDFELGEGVQFNLDFTRDMIVTGDYIQRGGVFNIASQPNNNAVKIKGNINQAASGTITETSTGQPVIELDGNDAQSVSCAGNISNSVALRINNGRGVYLAAPLRVAYSLELLQGAVTTSRAGLLIMLDNAIVIGGSANSFINGPIKKIGDDDFEFPVGKQGDYAPVKISGNSGSSGDEFIAEYFLGDPSAVYGYAFENPPVLRISRQEFWVLESASGRSSKRVGVYVGNHSNATALKDLVVMRWEAGVGRWQIVGNSFYNGIAIGTLVSNEVNSFGAFTLGSIVEMQNPLPLEKRMQRATPSENKAGLLLRVQSKKSEVVTFKVYDFSGRCIADSKLALIRGRNIVELPLRIPVKGLYVVGMYGSSGKLIEVMKVRLM